MTLKPGTTYYCVNPDCGYTLSTASGMSAEELAELDANRIHGHELVEAGAKDHVISFETISAVAHPELYNWTTERARRDIIWGDIPEHYWSHHERVDDERAIRDQWNGLHQLIAEGELIRNVEVFRRVTVDEQLDWEAP